MDLSSYTTKADLKGAPGVNTSNYEVKLDLADLKLEIDKIFIDKRKTVLAGLRKLSNVVGSDVVKKIPRMIN